MEEQTNYVGAGVFWLYIIAALAFTAIILKTLYEQPTRGDHHGLQSKTMLFSALATLSFSTLSYNMLNVLVQSYTLWARERSLSLADVSPASIWAWSVSSTLFQDFGNAIVQSSARYLWVEAALLATLCVCLFVGIEGQHRRVPRLWAFIGLGQILPVSFTQNLFYIALLRQPSRESQRRVPRKDVVILTGAYCACLIVAPATANTPWLIPQILLARGLLIVMQAYHWMPKKSHPKQTPSESGNLFDRDELYGHLALLTTMCLFAQTSLAFLGDSPADVARALLSHPAVSSLGCDFLLSAVSYLCWRFIGSDGPKRKIENGGSN